MSDLNSVHLTGRLVSDPEKLRPKEKWIAEFTIAQNNGEAEFFDVVVYGGWAENLAAKKGDAVLVEGRLKQDRWIDRDTGSQRSRVRVIASSVREFGRRSSRTQEEARATA